MEGPGGSLRVCEVHEGFNEGLESRGSLSVHYSHGGSMQIKASP